MGITGVQSEVLCDPDADGSSEQDVQLSHLHRLSSWMLILGTTALQLWWFRRNHWI